MNSSTYAWVIVFDLNIALTLYYPLADISLSALPAKPSKVGLDVVVNTISEVVQLESVVWNVTEVARLLLVTF